MFAHTRLPIWLLSILCVATALLGQEHTAAQSGLAPAITAAAADGIVRFTSRGEVCQMRVQIVSTSGESRFDSTWKDGDVLDWPIESPGQPLASGSYICIVMVKDLQGRVTQRGATLTAQGGQFTIEPRGGSDAIAVVSSDDNGPKITVLAHDGTNGALVSTGGDLTFRFGNFLAGKDSEKMRLTLDGKLGIGTDKPQAPLDVNGLIRTSKGIVFPDGTILTTAAGLATAGDIGSPGAPSAPNRGTQVRASILLPNPSALSVAHPTPRPNFAPASQFVVGDTGVHVGTTNPAYRLDVSGVVNTNAAYYLFGDLVLSDDGANTIVGRGAAGGHLNHGGGNVFIGQLAGDINGAGNENTFVGNNAGGLNTSGSQNSFFGFWAGRSNVLESGNTALGYLADITPGVTNSTAIGTSAKTGQSNTVVLGSINGINLAVATASTGIATQTPNQYLGVGGGITVDENNTNNGTVLANSIIAFGTAGGNGLSGEAIASRRTAGGNQYGLDFYTLYGNRMSITNAGRVGIGTSTPTAGFEVAAGTTTLADAWGTRSSGRFKENIEPIGSALEKTEQLRGVTFDYKDSGQHSVGFIAEEVECVLPEAVQHDAGGEVVGLDYNRITPLLVEALKTQQKVISSLQESNRALEERVRKLEAATAASPRP